MLETVQEYPDEQQLEEKLEGLGRHTLNDKFSRSRRVSDLATALQEEVKRFCIIDTRSLVSEKNPDVQRVLDADRRRQSGAS